MCIGEGGAGKDPAVAAKCYEEKSEDVLDFMRHSFGDEVDKIFVCAGAGGGTGSGSVVPLVKSSQELLKKQANVYKQKILNETKFKVSIEAASTNSWKKFVGENGLTFGINDFGKSAPYKDVFKHFGLTSENIVNKIKKMINN